MRPNNWHLFPSRLNDTLLDDDPQHHQLGMGGHPNGAVCNSSFLTFSLAKLFLSAFCSDAIHGGPNVLQILESGKASQFNHVSHSAVTCNKSYSVYFLDQL